MSFEIKLKCSHADIVFMEEYCSKGSFKMEDLFSKFVASLKEPIKEVKSAEKPTQTVEQKPKETEKKEVVQSVEDPLKDTFIKKKKPNRANDD